MIVENRQLVIDKPVEFEKELVEVQDCMKSTDCLEGFIEYTPI